MTIAEAFFAVALGLVAGAFAGLLGVGGGIIMVPAMVVVLDERQVVAQGTSLLVIIVTAIAATGANKRRGLLDVRRAWLLGAGGIAGAAVGALLALLIVRDAILQKMFGALLIVIAVRLVFSPPAQRSDEPPPGTRVP